MTMEYTYIYCIPHNTKSVEVRGLGIQKKTPNFGATVNYGKGSNRKIICKTYKLCRVLTCFFIFLS